MLCLCIVFGTFALDVFAAETNAETVDWGLTLAADEVTLAGLVLVMSQSGGNYSGDLEFGSAYRLERWTDDIWEPVPHIIDRVAWTAEAYVMPENTVRRWSISWERIYGVLPDGHYRVVKQFWDFHETGDYNNRDFYAEFVIAASHTCQSWDQNHLCDVCLALTPHECRNKNVDTVCDVCGKVTDRFCVVGNADWMGYWDSANDLGVMTYVGNGIYRKEFQDVPAGSYEFKITKNGKWDNAYGYNGQNFYFTVFEKTNITVDFVLRDGKGIIEVYGMTIGWDEDDEENPKASDLPVLIPAVLLLISTVALPVALYKRKNTQ